MPCPEGAEQMLLEAKLSQEGVGSFGTLVHLLPWADSFHVLQEKSWGLQSEVACLLPCLLIQETLKVLSLQTKNPNPTGSSPVISTCASSVPGLASPTPAPNTDRRSMGCEGLGFQGRLCWGTFYHPAPGSTVLLLKAHRAKRDQRKIHRALG